MHVVFHVLHFQIDAVTFSSAELKIVHWSSPLEFEMHDHT